jgi:transposase
VHLWADYRTVFPNGYGLFWFEFHYNEWRKIHKVCRYSNRRVRLIDPEQEGVLKQWRNAGDREQWKKATVIFGSFNGRPLAEMMEQVEKARETVLLWIDNFKSGGIPLLDRKIYTTCPALLDTVRMKQENLTKLLHQAPKLHGINRASWRLEDLCTIYESVYGIGISRTCALENLHKMGLGYVKSRELLTSPDPDFREKLDHIKHILAKLGETERFFSVDEYGPFAIKMKVGRSFTPVGQIKAVPQVQKSKGCIIVTAALELSRNQVSHFYSYKKNTAEMIKLLDLLLIEYRNTDKLYFSWDAASWHASKQLYDYIILVNAADYRNEHRTPAVELAPLPVSAQFLNVIESVFSGLAKAVIHNSDYESAEECRMAIDRHFQDRNAHFRQHPTRAGDKIWGGEIVPPEFNEGRHTKSLTGMRGAKNG